MSLVYAGGLAISLVGIAVVDRRWRLVAFGPGGPGRALGALALGVAFFLLWDLSGVALGIFFVGDSGLQSGLRLAPEVPVEEVGFLLLLCYLSLVVAAAAERAARRGGVRS